MNVLSLFLNILLFSFVSTFCGYMITRRYNPSFLYEQNVVATTGVTKYIVVHCKNDVRNGQPNVSLLFFLNATLVSLDRAPPMHTPNVVLLMSPRHTECKKHPYYRQSVRMRAEAKTIHSGLKRGVWHNGFFVHQNAELRHWKNRPL